MRPILFTMGSTQVASFFFMIMVGVLLATAWNTLLCRREGLRPEVALDFGMLGMVSGILGARLFHILVESPAYYWESPLKVFDFGRGGFVSWGAFLCVPLAVAIYIRLRQLPFWDYFDLVAAGLPIIKIFVRIACLLKGCCYGSPTTGWWGFSSFKPGSDAYHFYPGVPLHPTQILSITHAVLLFIAINIIYQKRQFAGQTASLMVILWVVPRFLIEFLRGDSDRGLYFGGLISTGQIMSILLFIAAVLMYFVQKRAHDRNAPRS